MSKRDKYSLFKKRLYSRNEQKDPPKLNLVTFHKK